MTVFVTGGSGFVGSRVLPALVQRGWRVVALDRSGRVRRGAPTAGALTVVAGDLLEPGRYRTALAEADVVVHLAASTGRASRAEHFRAIADGTDRLLEESRRGNVSRFLYVSSIAAGFDDTRGYHYAQAKVAAEAAVRRSGLAFTIVRPTMILGPGSPILDALVRLSRLPVIPVFGNGRTQVQPVHVDDVVLGLVEVIEADRFTGETLEIGGPQRISIESLLREIRANRTGQAARVIHVPFGLVVPPLRLAEAVGLGRVLPLNTGQLATFRCDGTAAPGSLTEGLRGKFRIDRMIEAPATAPGTTGSSTLDRECRAFTRYLLGAEPDQYVLDRYARAHESTGLTTDLDGFDGLLVRVARRSRSLARIADSYARLFAPTSVLRRKLVMLLAILETSSSSYRAIDAPPTRGLSVLVIALAGRGAGAVLSLAAGVLLFAPVRVAFGVARRRTP